MRRRFLQLSVLLATLAVVGLMVPQVTAAEGGATRLMGKLQELVRQLRELRQDYYKQKAQDDAEIEAARRNGELLRSQLEELREQEVLLDAELADYQVQVENLEAELGRKAVVREAVERFKSGQVEIAERPNREGGR